MYTALNSNPLTVKLSPVYLATKYPRTLYSLSSKRNQLLVITDRCGSGKTYAFLKSAVEEINRHFVIVVQTINKAAAYRELLIRLGADPNEVVIFDSQHPLNIHKKYNSAGAYLNRIAIITHARIWLDPPSIWNLSITGTGSTLIIDEVLRDTAERLLTNAFFLAMTNRRLGRDITRDARGNRIRPDDLPEIARACDTVYRAILSLPPAVALHECKNLLYPESLPFLRHYEAYPHRIAYLWALLTYAHLTGRVRPYQAIILLNEISILSPLYLWSQSFSAKVLLDATGKLFPYPNTLCKVMSPLPKTRPLPLLNTFLIPETGNRQFYRDGIKKDPLAFNAYITRKLRVILKWLSGQYRKIYICCWKDDDKDTLTAVDELIEWEAKAHSLVQKTYDLEATKFEITNRLRMETIVNYVVDELAIRDRVYILHYGLSRGANEYADSDCALIIGQYYYNKAVYENQETLCNYWDPASNAIQSHFDGNPVPQIMGHIIQETLRAMVRLLKEMDCYLFLDAEDADYQEILDSIKRFIQQGFYFKSVQPAPPLLTQGLSAIELEISLDYIVKSYALTKRQQIRVARLADAYPALVETRQVDITKPALAHLWGCKSETVKSHLEDLQRQTGGLISYQDLDPANQGGNRYAPKVYRITSAKVLVK